MSNIDTLVDVLTQETNKDSFDSSFESQDIKRTKRTTPIPITDPTTKSVELNELTFILFASRNYYRIKRQLSYLSNDPSVIAEKSKILLRELWSTLPSEVKEKYSIKANILYQRESIQSLETKQFKSSLINNECSSFDVAKPSENYFSRMPEFTGPRTLLRISPEVHGNSNLRYHSVPRLIFLPSHIFYENYNNFSQDDIFNISHQRNFYPLLYPVNTQTPDLYHHFLPPTSNNLLIRTPPMSKKRKLDS